MRWENWKTLLAIPLVLAAFTLAGCRVEQTEEGEMPEVDVDVEEGNLPEYDVDAADVEVETEERTITVPDVDVEMPEEETDPEDEEAPPGS